jgi:SAM-dependent methyltransferase
MPEVEANRRQWDGEYAWSQGGDEWSAGWGGPDAQWHFTLWPRLRQFLPASAILEIGPGHGRWTRYLLDYCESYVGVDLSEQSVDRCRRRFAAVEHVEIQLTDGKSLAGVGDRSIDFAFSFDSLVHVEEDVLDGYLRELARALTPDGVAFLHHSNLAACRPVARPLRLALCLAERIRKTDTGGFDQWRGEMSAERLADLAAQSGLACIGQEVISWLGGRLLDCISLVTPRGSRWERPNIVVHNPYFMAEAASCARAARLSSRTGASFRLSPDQPSPQPLGPLSSIAFRSLGPWGFSVVGPWPRLRGRAVRRQPFPGSDQRRRSAGT